MRMRLAAMAAIMFLALSAPAYAGGCYSAREVEAEQGLRIHSELMVIGLTCLKMPGGQDLYKKYAQFTQNNQDLIAGYETTLIDFYRTQGAAGNAEKSLHTLRTKLANSISTHTIEMGTQSFCTHFSPRLDKALSMDRDHLRRWAQHVWPDTPVSRPICASTASR